MEFIRLWWARLNPGKPLPKDIEQMSQLLKLAEQTGQVFRRHFAVQPGGRGNTRVILLTK